MRLLCLTYLVAAILLSASASSCAKRSRSTGTNAVAASATTRRININTATAKELEALPGIGEALAERIIEHRQKYGPFRRAEHLIMVRGISDARFRAVRDLITVE